MNQMHVTSLHPQPGDTVNTTANAPFAFGWDEIKRWALAQGIHAYQRIQRGFPYPAWTRTHSRLYVGHIPINEIEAMKQVGLVSWPEARRLSLCHDWLLSVTDPFVRWDSWELDVLPSGDKWCICRPLFHDYTDDEIGARLLRAAAIRLIGRRYDRGQLIDIYLNSLLKIPFGEYKRIFDFGPHLTVCSGGNGACYEHHRKYLRDVMLRGRDPWPRLFGGMWLERICPALYEGLPRRATWDLEFGTIRKGSVIGG